MNVNFSLSLLLFAMVSGQSGALAASSCSATSGAAAPALVELYTSEGCDSCPPADRWFSTLKADAAQGKVVPLAFHVDYWDYIGWKDRFGDARFGVRHRETAARGGAKVVYTPQVFVDGREYQFWRKVPSDKLAGAAAAKAPRAELRVSARPAAASLQVSVTGNYGAARRGAEAYIALFENGLSSDVTAGENRGVQLHHDFVVRRWLGPFAFDAGKLELATEMPLPSDAVISHSGIAVVAVDDRGSVLQALSLPLRECGG